MKRLYYRFAGSDAEVWKWHYPGICCGAAIRPESKTERTCSVTRTFQRFIGTTVGPPAIPSVGKLARIVSAT